MLLWPMFCLVGFPFLKLMNTLGMSGLGRTAKYFFTTLIQSGSTKTNFLEHPFLVFGMFIMMMSSRMLISLTSILQSSSVLQAPAKPMTRTACNTTVYINFGNKTTTIGNIRYVPLWEERFHLLPQLKIL